jgi:anti-sigma regulatory factor (Ser/Thr protein kinase)
MRGRKGAVDCIVLSLPSDPKYLGLLRTVVGRAAEMVGFSAEEKDELMLGVNEGCANIIRHCYRMDPGQKIDVRIRVLPDRMEVRLRDFGEFWACEEFLAEADALAARADAAPLETVGPGSGDPIAGDTIPGDPYPGGLGVRLMREVLDEVDYRPAPGDGTLLTMVKLRTERGA